MIVTSVQIKTAKTQKHLYCPVFTEIKLTPHGVSFIFLCKGFESPLRKRFGEAFLGRGNTP